MLECESLVEEILGRGVRPFSKFEFTDNHMHIDPARGEGIGAVKKFERAGGKRIFLVNKSASSLGLDVSEVGSFERLFERTIALAAEIKERTSVKAYAVIGIHPAEFVSMCREFSIDKALRVGKEALDIASKKIAGGSAVALGEVGTPHFQVEDDVMNACMELLTYAIERASKVDCAVQLHTGSIGEEKFMELAELAKRFGMEPKRLIKHYSPPFIRAAEEAGLYPSLIASEENISKALREGNRFMMESDYIDETGRPGAVVGPKSVPSVSKKLLAANVLDEEDLWRIHLDNVRDAYGIELE